MPTTRTILIEEIRAIFINQRFSISDMVKEYQYPVDPRHMLLSIGPGDLLDMQSI